MSYRTRNIVLASALAVLAVVFMLLYASRSNDGDELGNQVLRVLVAGRTIDEGTPGSTLNSGPLIEKRIPRGCPRSDHPLNEVRGLVATQETLSGEQVSLRCFGPDPATGVLTQLSKRQRAVRSQESLDRPRRHAEARRPRRRPRGWTPVTCDKCRLSSVIVRKRTGPRHVLEPAGGQLWVYREVGAAASHRRGSERRVLDAGAWRVVVDAAACRQTAKHDVRPDHRPVDHALPKEARLAK